MAQVQVYNQEGKKTSKLELADSVFGIEPNEYAMHLAVVSYLANQRQGTQSTLTRSEVSGGGAKPWRQKGTGRARQGSTRSPQWTHGGIALGPKPRKYTVNLNKKVKRLAMKSALSTKVAEGEMMVVNKVEFDGIKTKNVVAMLKGLKAAKKTLIITAESNEQIYKSARNIEGVKVATVNTLCVYDILNCDSFVVLKPIITEESMMGIMTKKYTFKVAKDANKIEIAKAVESVFPGTKVAKVNTMNVRGQKRRQGMHEGYTPSWKKAIVTLTEDSKEIEFFNDMM